MHTRLACVMISCVVAVLALSQDTRAQDASPYKAWSHGPGADAACFPIAVWLQHPKNAKRYREANFNLYVGLWKGPTEEQLAALKVAGMPVICTQNDVGLRHLADRTIVGWLHDDEPDNAQALPDGKGWGPPVKPETVIEMYRRMKKADASRPVLLNLGQGVAWDNWHGRGVRSRHPEDYVEYVRGADIVSFDIYPVVHPRPEVAGKLWFVAEGVTRLRKWTGDHKVVWNCIECTRIGNVDVKPTPHQVRAEVWMSIIHGSRGIIYFVHQFKPKFIEAGLFADLEMLEAVTGLNAQIRDLAPVINAPEVAGAVTVVSSSPDVPVAMTVRRHAGATYVFTVCMRDAKTTATFTVKGLRAAARVEVLGENRRLTVAAGRFTDDFAPWSVHLYRVSE